MITVLEHERLVPTKAKEKVGEKHGRAIYIDYEDFDSLRKFVQKDGNYRFLDVSKGGRELKVRQYVGVLETPKGTVVEILPKVSGDVKTNRNVLLKMIRRLRQTPFSHFVDTNVHTDRMHLLEVFISLFLDELSDLVRKGVVPGYKRVYRNERYLKGKLQEKEQIRRNALHKERFFVEYDEFSPDIPENRVIRRTLDFLQRRTVSFRNKKLLREYRFVFDEVKPHERPEEVFKRLRLTRRTQHYRKTMQWCEMFLRQYYATTSCGSEPVVSIMFDMNKVFEDYVAYRMKRDFPGLKIDSQHSSQHLVIAPKNLFRMRPDLLIGDEVLADIKWKNLDERKGRYGLSQADLYQMYAYGKKYGRRELYLIYPRGELFTVSQIVPFEYEEKMNLKLLCFDCDRDHFLFSNGDEAIPSFIRIGVNGREYA